MDYEAGYLNTTGGDNTFIGAESGEINTTGYDNTFVGEESGANNTTGYENTFIGEDAGFSNTTGYKQTFIGNEVGISSDIGYRNTGVGSEAMSDVDEGHHNTGLGDSAAIDIGVGIYNTMVGAASGVATEHADYNTFIGAQAGWDNNRTNSTSNANHNTYLGFSAGFTNREGQYNVGIGSLADFDNNNRSNAIFMGYDINASNDNVMGFGNRGFTDGQFAVTLGHDHDTRGDYSIAMGYLANLSSLADYSVAIGDRVDIEENDVVGIGRSVDIDNQFAIAIGSTTIAQNDGAIVLGYNASSTDPNSLLPTNNIAIGVDANVQGLNAVAIGNAATAVNDNTMVLGGATNPLSVGIGTDTPNANASLDLSGTSKGLLFNRLTTALRTTLATSLGTGDEGLTVYDTEEDGLYSWDGTEWKAAGGGDTAALESRIAALESAALGGAGTGMTPQAFNYQSVIADASNNAVRNQSVGLRLNILQGASTTVYSETHSVTTNDNGLVALKIGEGTVVSGTFNNIDWSTGDYSLNIEADITGGTAYQTIGTSQLVSVPYALHAATADRLTNAPAMGSSMIAPNSTSEIETLRAEVARLSQLVEQLAASRD